VESWNWEAYGREACRRLDGLGIVVPSTAMREYAAKQLAMLLHSLTLMDEIELEGLEPATVYRPAPESVGGDR
jgi:hypothetical protein